jgi:Peptidase family M23
MGQKRWVIYLVVVSLSFVVPAAICVGLALLNASSVIGLVVGFVAAGAWMVLLALVNWWEFTSRWLRWVWAAALIAIVALRAPEARGLPLATGFDLSLLAAGIIAAVGMWLVTAALAARRCDGDAIDLAFPLRDGRFLCTDGGDGARSFLMNYHYGFGQHRASGVNRSMRYAMDVVEVGAGGGESIGFLPRRNDAYRIWERPLHAPCHGRVVHAVSDVADNTAFGTNRPYGIGNHVVVRKGNDEYVVLGHMRQGTIGVKPGEDVQAGQEIGRVGNSGWTERPHLHMQAMRSADGDWWHGEPLALRFGGRFLVRNQMAQS